VLDKVLLGFVLDEPKTGYELGRELEKWAELGMSASQGSIHPALQGLLKAGQVDQKVEREGARLRKTYGATASGKALFRQWLSSPIPLPKGRDEATLRLLFAHQLSLGDRERLFQEYTERLRLHMGELSRELKLRKAARSEGSEAERERAHNELMVLEWLKSHAKFLAKWHHKKRAKLETQRAKLTEREK
jgi:DNA-binding PadR family transcriptional regulator